MVAEGGLWNIYIKDLQKISPLSFTTATALTKIVNYYHYYYYYYYYYYRRSEGLYQFVAHAECHKYRFRRTQLPGNKAVCKQSRHKPGPVVLVTFSYLYFLRFFILLIPITTKKRIITCHFCTGSLKYVWLQAKLSEVDLAFFHNREGSGNYYKLYWCKTMCF